MLDVQSLRRQLVDGRSERIGGEVHQAFVLPAAEDARAGDARRDEEAPGRFGPRPRDPHPDGVPGAGGEQVVRTAAGRRHTAAQQPHADRGQRRHVLHRLVRKLVGRFGDQPAGEARHRRAPRLVAGLPDAPREQPDEPAGEQDPHHDRRRRCR
ncbi:hypothetical protein [Actinomadura sp. CNU-125]|uniref:hypothetical protein n=1 Tax=Actinomadura sp. CNU-125 TaxID=1904961 RepID=UPI001177DFA1|nr:hypothetical protein [Actinomadura sp. CNU-125]